MKNIFLIITAILILLIGGCAGCAFVAFKQVAGAQAEIDPIAEKFITAWNDSDLNSLYKIAKRADPSIDEEKFKAQLTEEISIIGKIQSHSPQGFRVNSFNGNTTASASYSLRGSVGIGTLNLSLKKSPSWEITGFTVNHSLGR